MSLNTPLSVGDYLGLAGVAWNVAKALRPGSNIAADDFSELQRLLFSLGNTLKLVDQIYFRDSNILDSEPRGIKADISTTALTETLSQCKSTLKPLEKFVNWYSPLDTSETTSSRNSSDTKVTGTWMPDWTKLWTLLLWNTEGDNIAKLKHTLTVHTQNLNLVVTAANGEKLDGMFKWLKTSLESLSAERGLVSSPGLKDLTAATSALNIENERLSFEVYREKALVKGSAIDLLCPRVEFVDIWPTSDDSTASISLGSVFKCVCSSEDLKCSHRMEYYLLPTISLLVRRIGSNAHLSWQIYLEHASSRKPLSLLIQGVHPKFLAEFERWADRLKEYQVDESLKKGTRNSLVSYDSHGVSILHAKSDAIPYSDKLLSLRFEFENTHLVLGRMSSLQILHHSIASNENTSPGDRKSMHGHYLPQRTATVVIYSAPNSSDSQPKKYTIQLHFGTEVSTTDDPRFVTVHKVFCTEESTHTDPGNETIECSNIKLEFSDPDSAKRLRSDLKHTKRFLQMQYLSGPRWGEQLVMSRDIPRGFMIKHLALSNGTLQVIHDPEAGKFRIVFQSSDHSAAVCFELPLDFLEQLTSGAIVVMENRPAWFMDIDEKRINIQLHNSDIDPWKAFSRSHQLLLDVKAG